MESFKIMPAFSVYEKCSTETLKQGNNFLKVRSNILFPKRNAILLPCEKLGIVIW